MDALKYRWGENNVKKLLYVLKPYVTFILQESYKT